MNRQTAAPFLALLLVAGTFLPSALHAQEGRGFLFSRPGATFNFRTGYDIPRANSDIFSYTSELLTLEKSSFAAPAITVDIGVHLTERLELVAGVGYARSETLSEFRDWEDNRGQPIEQVTTHSKLPFTVSARYFLRDRGRQPEPFRLGAVAAGALCGSGSGRQRVQVRAGRGLRRHRDARRLQRPAGVGRHRSLRACLRWHRVRAGPAIRADGRRRYSWSSSPMDRSFEGFENIDLSGFQILAGIGIRMSG